MMEIKCGKYICENITYQSGGGGQSKKFGPKMGFLGKCERGLVGILVKMRSTRTNFMKMRAFEVINSAEIRYLVFCASIVSAASL